ncbi:YybH family protein [Desulfogranum mediterraneum]|uniref:YybH family protein n=1 Tax=Desulfogranum mediterraneum TaxID=160661 RepID=UPI0003F924D9|nr:nuclear transport factor 2 family protein [Desulfogranum mediterraneum]
MNCKHLLLITTLALSTLNPTGGSVAAEISAIREPSTAHALFTRAMNERNLEQLCALYADQAVMVLRSGKEVRGREAVQEVFSRMVQAIESLELETVYMLRSDKSALFRSHYTATFRNGEGELETHTNSGIEMLEKQPDGSWLFVIDHQVGADRIPRGKPDGANHGE